MRSLWGRAQTRYRATLSTALCRRPIRMRNSAPLISFTFDDFPRSALDVAGEILKQRGVAGTYYASLGLMNRDSPVGPIFGESDLVRLVGDGHELGSHTFSHRSAWSTRPR